MKNSHGNRRLQQKRRRERLKKLPKPEKKKELYQLIDGNMSYYPVAYCRHHKGWLSQGLIITHRCVERHCNGYEGEEADQL